MKQYKPKTKIVKKIGSVVLPLLNRRFQSTDSIARWRNSLCADVSFENLRIYQDEYQNKLFVLKVNINVKGYVIIRKSHLEEETIIKRINDGDQYTYGMRSSILFTTQYQTVDRKTKMDLTKRVKEVLDDYISDNLKSFVKIDHLLDGGKVYRVMVDKINYL